MAGIKEAAPNIVALILRHSVGLQRVAADAGLISVLVAQAECQGASSREKIAVLACLECMVADVESNRTLVADAGILLRLHSRPYGFI